ncbi:MFS transporter [Marisediminicola sp. LYQ134]|uniref:MFS transporter n=1 Tax=Marisediminicola sp. LYQ134 TaxID=3391061 RepID=UPI0039834D7E
MRWAPWALLVAAAGAISVMTAPGQTAGLSVFTDPLISELGISRTEISASYFAGTIVGAAAQPFVGRALDRFGARVVTAAIGVVFASVLLALSFASDIWGLTGGFVGVRMLGQGALSLAATTAVARSISRHRGLALGVTSAIGSAGISLAPVGLERLISVVGIHSAWRWEALVVAAVVIPLAFILPGRSRRPHEFEDPSTAQIVIQRESWTLSEAMRTGMFWVIAASLAVSGMLGTALAFHQIAILGEQGLSPFEAAANFLPQTATGIAATLLVGVFIDRISPKLFVIFSMLTLAGSLLLLPVVAPGATALLYGLVLGAAGGSLRGMEAAAYVRYYGTAHIGTIRGVATAINLASTAVGPIALSLGVDISGSFILPAVVLSALPIAVAVLAIFVKPPSRGATSAGG